MESNLSILQVAKLAGVPKSVIKSAKAKLSQLETGSHTLTDPLTSQPTNATQEKATQGKATERALERPQVASPINSKQMANGKQEFVPAQADMFATVIESAVEAKLKEINLDELTPKQALDLMYQLKGSI